MNYRLIRANLQEYTLLLRSFSPFGPAMQFLEKCRDTMKLEEYELFMIFVNMADSAYTNGKV